MHFSLAKLLSFKSIKKIKDLILPGFISSLAFFIQIQVSNLQHVFMHKIYKLLTSKNWNPIHIFIINEIIKNKIYHEIIDLPNSKHYAYLICEHKYIIINISSYAYSINILNFI